MTDKRKYWLCAMLCTVFFLFPGCGAKQEDTTAPSGQPAESSAYTEEIAYSTDDTDEFSTEKEAAAIEETIEEETMEDMPAPREVTLMAVGDNLMHMGVVYAGKQEDGSWNYSFLFEGIKDYLEIADIKVINQETIFAGNQLGFSGYPYFNSPTEVGDAIADAGFNVVLHATNHAADQNLSGLLYCAEYWENHPDVLMVGISKDASGTEDSIPDIPILTVEDTRFAILNYTYGPNAEILSKALWGHLNMLCDYNETNGYIDFTTLRPQVLEDIAAAEELADVVIVFPHWGTEYSTVVSTYQKEWAMQMTEAGADLIIGAHPHVVQSVEWIEADNGNRALCYYSLGNYVSTQKDPISMLEAMAFVTFRENDTGDMEIVPDRSGALPLVCHYTSGPVRLKAVYTLDEYTEELAAAHGIRNYGGKILSLDDLYQWTEEILGDASLTPWQIKNDSY